MAQGSGGEHEKCKKIKGDSTGKMKLSKFSLRYNNRHIVLHTK